MNYKEYFLINESKNRNIEWFRVKPLTDKKAIDKLENKYNFKLPKDLKDCIKNNNGGYPNLNIIRTKTGREYDVRMLLSYNKEDYTNIYKSIDYFRNNGKTLIPFAIDSGGNYFCIENGKIVLWTQEDDTYDICNTFTEFLNNLK